MNKKISQELGKIAKLVLALPVVIEEDLDKAEKIKPNMEASIRHINNVVNEVGRTLSKYNAPDLQRVYFEAIQKGISSRGFNLNKALDRLNDWFNKF